MGVAHLAALESSSYSTGGIDVVEYELTNAGEAPIRTLTLGHGEYYEWKGEGWSVPKVVEGPPGWTGRVVHGHENPYVSVVWLADPRSQLARGEKLGGFRIRVRPEQKDFSKIKFRVFFTKGGCHWGVTRQAHR